MAELGNPLESENSAFRWLVVVLVGAALVVIVAKVISVQAGMVLGALLMFFVGFLIIKGVMYLIGSPDEDDYEDGK